MKKKTVCRLIALTSSAVVGVAALAMFAGCTTKRPEITITYNFNGKDYAVDYTLSRNDAPQTVQHFIELADAGYYDGMVIHDYQSNALYTGGYRLENGELEEVDYFTEVKKLEQEKGITFTQSVWRDAERNVPLYTVYGEFAKNGISNQYGRDNYYAEGALVMYYTDKGGNDQVTVARADGGKENNGNPYQSATYLYNSATSLFYTFTGQGASGGADSLYCVFGMASKYSEQMLGENGLLTAISNYINELEGEDKFTEEIANYKLNRFEPFDDVKTGDKTANYALPREMPITVKTVKVNKY